MAVVEAQRCFQDRINCRDQRLERVVDQMGEAKREENTECRRNLNGLDLVHAGGRAVCGRFRCRAHGDTVSAVGRAGENRDASNS